MLLHGHWYAQPAKTSLSNSHVVVLCCPSVSALVFLREFKSPGPAIVHGMSSQAPIDQFRAAVKKDLGVDIGRENASCFLDSAWLQANGSPYENDVVPKEWSNTAARFLCSRNVVYAAKELAEHAGDPLPRGRISMPETDSVLYEYWPR